MAKNKSANEIILNLEYEKEVSTLLIAFQISWELTLRFRP